VFQFAPHAEVISAGTDAVDLPRALAALRRHGVRVLVCEGGPLLNAELLEHGLVDELCVTYAPFLGGDPLGMFTRGVAPLQGAQITHATSVDGSVFVRALIDRNGGR
jgi:riboflavin biosynthesis pyrimidine reductase